MRFHYDFLEQLGRGTFGKVVKAVNNADGLWYAIQIIQLVSFTTRDDNHMGGDITNEEAKEVKKRLEDEIIAMRVAGKHVNICKFKEAYVEDNFVYEWPSHCLGNNADKGLAPTYD